MALRVITGPAGSGISAEVRLRARDHAARAGSALVLVGAAPDVTWVTEALADGGTVGVAVQTLDGFLDSLWHAHGDGRAIVSEAQRALLLAETVSYSDDGPATGWSFRSAVGLLAALVQRTGESAPARMSSEQPTAAQLLRVVQRYTRLASGARLIERAEAHRRAIEVMGPSDTPGLIVVDGVTSLTAAQERFVVSAAGWAEVLVCLTYDGGVPATGAAMDIVERLSAAGQRDARSAEASDEPAELRTIRLSLGSVRQEHPSPTGALRLSEAWGDEAECARIVAEVQDALASGAPPESVMVVLRDPGRYLPGLTTALAEARVEAEWDMRVPFGTAGLGRALQAAVRASGGDQQAALELLRSPYSPASASDVDRLDTRLRRASGIRSDEVERWCRESCPATGAFLASVRRAVRALGAAEGPERWHRLISEMLGHAWGSGTGVGPQMLLDAAAARAFLDVTEAASAVGGAVDRATAVAEALGATAISVAARRRQGAIRVVRAERARGERVECVIVGGLTAGEFPRFERDDALTAPRLRSALLSAGIDVTSRSGTDEERLLYYQVVTRATRRLVLSWQSHDADGRPLRPSTFLEETLDLFIDPDRREHHYAPLPHTALRLDGHGLHPAGPATERRRRRSDAATAAAPGVAAVVPSRALSPRHLAELSRRVVFSVTEVEQYLQCPYQWFIGRVLRPRELDVALDAGAVGSLAHRIMARFYDRYAEVTGWSRVEPAGLGVALDVHRTVVSEEAGSARPTTARDELELEWMASGTRALVEADATLLDGMDPVHREWDFGMSDGDPPEVFDGFALTGRVDRIDLDDTRLVVTDYKLGTVGPDRAHAAFERNGLVQLPLYAEVAARRLRREIAGGLYRSVKHGNARGFVRQDLTGGTFTSTDRIESPAIESLVARALAITSDALDRLRSGDIEPRPLGGSCPAWCPARDFCNEWSPRER